MTRRGLLGMLAASLTLDPEKLLWVPGQKLISIPAGAVRAFHPNPYFMISRRGSIVTTEVAWSKLVNGVEYPPYAGRFAMSNGDYWE